MTQPLWKSTRIHATDIMITMKLKVCIFFYFASTIWEVTEVPKKYRYFYAKIFLDSSFQKLHTKQENIFYERSYHFIFIVLF